tara:strand:+ start:1028 stop:1240 length:213 start_codon:yes stop_codon:yes gene_type:complete
MCLPRSRPAPTPPPKIEEPEPTKQEIYDSTPHEIKKTTSTTKTKKKGKASLRTDLSVGGSSGDSGLSVGT